MVLTKHIQNLLFFHDCVIVPDFGAFITIREEANLNPTTDIFLPPKRSVLFNRSLKNDDGLLVGHVSKTMHMGYDQAYSYVREQVIDWENNLKSNDKLILENIGDILIDGNDQWKFVPKKTENYLPDSYGLFAFHSEAVALKAKPEEDAIPEGVLLTEKGHPQPNMSRRSDHESSYRSLGGGEADFREMPMPNAPNSNSPKIDFPTFEKGWGMVRYVLLTFIVVVIMVFSYFNRQSQEGKAINNKFTPFGSSTENREYNSGYEPEVIRMSQHIVNYQFFKDVVTDIQYKIKTRAFDKGITKKRSVVGGIKSKSRKNRRKQTPSTGQYVGSSKVQSVISANYYIIEGAYLDHYNANSRVKQLRSKGYSTATIAGRTRLGQYRVAYSSHDSKQDADRGLKRIKRSVKKSAWIYADRK